MPAAFARKMAPMRWLILLLALLGALPLRASEDGALTRLLTLEEARPWAAVGRVNVAGNAFCTGTLIAPDRVLTAAHCLFFEATGRPVPPGEIHFLAGYRQGHFLAHRKVRRYVMPEAYRPDEADREVLLRADIAVLELESPIAANAVNAFERVDRPFAGDAVAVVSYARARAHAPSIQEPCHVLRLDGRIMLLSCDVDFGASGSPVFLRRDARPKVAALVSAMTTWNGRKVAVAIDLHVALDDLLQRLAASDARSRTERPDADLTLEERLGRTESTGIRKISRPPD